MSELKFVNERPKSLHSLVLLEDGETMCCASEEHPLIFVYSRGATTKLYGHTDGGVMALRTKGNLLASGGGDGVVKVWNVLEEQCVRSFHLYQHPVSALQWIGDLQIISGDERGVLVIWSLEDDSPTVLRGHNTRINHIEVISAAMIVTVDASGHAVLWKGDANVALEEKGRDISAVCHLKGVAGLGDGILIVFAIEQNLVLYASDGTRLRGQHVQFPIGRDNKWGISHLKPVGDCQLLIAIDQFACDTNIEDDMIICASYDSKEGFVQDFGFSGTNTEEVDSIGQITSLDVSSDESSILAGCEKKNLFHLTTTAQAFTQESSTIGPFNGTITAVSFIHDGIACVTNRGELFIRTTEGDQDILFPKRIIQEETV
eukprot:m.242044 g.242044  ORF g.242044 m.242044 type:complete len:374 (-) comp29321_c0_seq1:96-1217(-)